MPFLICSEGDGDGQVEDRDEEGTGRGGGGGGGWRGMGPRTMGRSEKETVFPQLL